MIGYAASSPCRSYLVLRLVIEQCGTWLDRWVGSLWAWTEPVLFCALLGLRGAALWAADCYRHSCTPAMLPFCAKVDLGGCDYAPSTWPWKHFYLLDGFHGGLKGSQTSLGRGKRLRLHRTCAFLKKWGLERRMPASLLNGV